MVQHSCIFGCNKKSIPGRKSHVYLFKGDLCVWGEDCSCTRPQAVEMGIETARLGQAKASPTRDWPEGDAKRMGHNLDFLQPVFQGLSHQDASSRSLCLTATSGPVLRELIQSSFEAAGISGSQNIP